MQIKRIDFETILPVWQEKLWPNRQSAIEPHSVMTWPFDGDPPEYDLKITSYEPTFLAVYHNDTIIATGSGHRSSDIHYRMRGFWVAPDFRRQGLLHKILQQLCEQAITEGCHMMWGIPRKASLTAYTKFGFETVGDFFQSETAQANIYAFKLL